MSGKDIYKDGLQVSKDWIAALGDVDLDRLMHDMLCAQSERCGAAIKEVRTNTEVKAADEGCDGWSGVPGKPDVWLGDRETCWQFKAGSNSQPGKLGEEVGKPIPRQTLAAGGRFVVIASASTNGLAGENSRKAKLIEAAELLNLPTDKIDVIGSERLASWVNQHPALVPARLGFPRVLSLDQFAKISQHDVEWQADEAKERDLERFRSGLAYPRGGERHLHLQGRPGVGKSRFALELCRRASWSRETIYLRQTLESEINQIILGAAQDKLVRLVIVADEVQQGTLSVVRDLIDVSEGRIRLVTIGLNRCAVAFGA